MELIHVYVKNLKHSHIDHDLSFSTAILKDLEKPAEGTNKIVFNAIDASGTPWRFRISTRLTGLYPKPVVLRSTWHPFVEQKGLKPSDRVTFYVYRGEGNEVMFRVRAQRVIMRLMGQDVWVDL